MTDGAPSKGATVRGPSFAGHGGPGSGRERTIERAKNVRGALSRLLGYLAPHRGVLYRSEEHTSELHHRLTSRMPSSA
jgi:hypothetical protein